MRPSVMKVSANRNSFQFCRNKKIATVESAGRVSGSITRAKILNSPAPSSRAASSSSRGSPSKNPFMMKVPKASPNAVYGPISAKGVLSRPSVLRFMKSGMSAICSGIVRPTSTIPYTTRSEEHTSELQSRQDLVCRLLLEKKKQQQIPPLVADDLAERVPRDAPHRV